MSDLGHLFKQQHKLETELERLEVLIYETKAMIMRPDLSNGSLVSFTDFLYSLCHAERIIKAQLKAIDQHFTHRGTA